MKTTVSTIIVCLLCWLYPPMCLHTFAQPGKDNVDSSFSFAFLTDIHLTYDRDAVPGFRQAIGKVNELHPDFVITGGDLIMDALNQRYSRADSLYNLYKEVTGDFRMPVHNTMGNHEIWGIYKNSGADMSHSEYGERMFEKRLGRSFYSFDHKGWKFMVLNSIEDAKNGKYIGMIDSLQIEWIQEELSRTDLATPVVVCLHIPLLTSFAQKYYGSTVPNDSGLVVVNAKQVLDLFAKHNLKLVLQGHLHTVEEIIIDGTHFITGGAVAAAWWKGPYRSYEEGFILVTVHGSRLSWDYIDYGWKVPITSPPPRSSR